jgi:hypothetical protein
MATADVALPTVPREVVTEPLPEGTVAFTALATFTKAEARRWLARQEKRFEAKSRKGGTAAQSLAALDAAEACRRASRFLSRLDPKAHPAPVDLEALMTRFRGEIEQGQLDREADVSELPEA